MVTEAKLEIVIQEFTLVFSIHFENIFEDSPKGCDLLSRTDAAVEDSYSDCLENYGEELLKNLSHFVPLC